MTARLPTTASRRRADEVAKLQTRQSIVGNLVGRVVEVGDRFAVLVDCDGKPYGSASV